MLEKKMRIAKGLFCCVGFLRGLSAVPCDKHTKSKAFLQWFVSIAGVFALIIPLMTFTVSATSAYDNTFVDPTEYGTVNYWTDNQGVTYDCSFPNDWHTTMCYSGDWNDSDRVYHGTLTGDNVSFVSDSEYDTICLRLRPLGGDMTGGEKVGHRLRKSRLLDFSYMPYDTFFQTTFAVEIDSSGLSAEDITAHGYLFFVDSDGYVVNKASFVIKPDVYNVGTGVLRFVYHVSMHFSDYGLTDNVAGVAPLFTLKHVNLNPASSVTIQYSETRILYTMHALEFEAMQNEKLKNTLNKVQSALAEQDKKLDALPDKIGDQMQNVMDSEKEQAKDEGNKFVDQILDKLPDPSQGILDALGDLTSAINYTGTDATLQIPAIVLPGIDGLFPKTEIWGGTEFSFSDYVEMLPSGLLTLVKSLFTIAIVLFCVYELKGIISYCLTLKEKDGG